MLSLFNSIGEYSIESKVVYMPVPVFFLIRWTNFLKTEKYTYTINFYGWTRPVKVKMARDTCDALHLTEEYPNFESFSNGEGNIYKTYHEYKKFPAFSLLYHISFHKYPYN